MVRNVFLIYIIIFINFSLLGDRFVKTGFIDRGAPIFLMFNDIDNNNRDELYGIYSYHRTEDEDSFESYEYIYEWDEKDSFVLRSGIEGYGFIDGIGDFDNDGLKEYVVRKVDKPMMFMEQSDSFSFPDSITGETDSIWSTLRKMGVSKFMKADSIERIYGIGIPWLSSSTGAYGWYIMESTGDNEYEITHTYLEDVRINDMAIGDLDDNGYMDVVIEDDVPGDVTIYEATDSTQMVFNKKVSWDAGYGNITQRRIILPDIDKDGHKEMLSYVIKSVGYIYDEYIYIIMEDEDGDNMYDTVFVREFASPTNVLAPVGGDIGYGDIDGDGEYEMIFTGGTHWEAWECVANNTYRLMYSWTSEEYNITQSWVLCHDFNKNGYDEIIISGGSSGVSATYIFEDSIITTLIDSAVAYEGEGIEKEGIDGDDYVIIYFSNKTNIPEINSQNINNLLPLSNSHSWLDGVGIIRGAQWSNDSTKLIVYLSDIGDIPTLTIGDTIYPNRLELKSYDNITPIKGTTTLTGTFDPPEWVENNITANTQENRPVISPIQGGINITNYTGDITIYDVTGRTVKTTHITPSNPSIHITRGIYFIKVGDRIKKVNVVR